MWRKRLERILLIVSCLLLSWLWMQVVHEAGHVAAAWLWGGSIAKVVLHPLAISRTDVANNANLGAEEKAAKLKALDEELAKLEKRMAEREQKTAANAG